MGRLVISPGAPAVHPVEQLTNQRVAATLAPEHSDEVHHTARRSPCDQRLVMAFGSPVKAVPSADVS